MYAPKVLHKPPIRLAVVAISPLASATSSLKRVAIMHATRVVSTSRLAQAAPVTDGLSSTPDAIEPVRSGDRVERLLLIKLSCAYSLACMVTLVCRADSQDRLLYGSRVRTSGGLLAASSGF